MNCPRCRKKMEYMPELARKGKPSHFWCSPCSTEWIIMRKQGSFDRKFQ